jgi:hypothetical protein
MAGPWWSCGCLIALTFITPARGTIKLFVEERRSTAQAAGNSENIFLRRETERFQSYTKVTRQKRRLVRKHRKNGT